MTVRIKHQVAGLLGTSSIALGILVPGGPVETRSFSHMSPLTLGVFNTFLTTLVLGSLLSIYFVLRSKRWAIIAAAIFGLSYLGVYGLDLVEIFPVSPDGMPSALWVIQVFGTLLSLPLIVLSVQALQALDQPLPANAPLSASNPAAIARTPQMVAAMVLGMVALGIITFATKSAMGV